MELARLDTQLIKNITPFIKSFKFNVFVFVSMTVAVNNSELIYIACRMALCQLGGSNRPESARLYCRSYE